MRFMLCVLLVFLFSIVNANSGEFRDYPARVLRIVDGDTIVVSVNLGFGLYLEDKVRFFQYDAPETWRPTDDAEKQLGMKAKEYLTSLILDKFVTLKVPTKERGSFGRILAFVFVGEIDVVETMKFEGFVKKEEWR